MGSQDPLPELHFFFIDLSYHQLNYITYRFIIHNMIIDYIFYSI